MTENEANVKLKQITENDLEEHYKVENIKTILESYSQIDGSHHKAWCLDQIARIVYGEEYQDFVHNYEYIDDDGVEHDEPIYEWDCGIAP